MKVYCYDEPVDWRAYDAVVLPFPPTFDKVQTYRQGNYDAVTLPFPPPYAAGPVAPIQTFLLGVDRSR